MVTTRELMDKALALAGLDKEPADTGIYLEGKDIKKVLIGVDMETPEILLGKELGVDVVISHHPTAGDQIIKFHEVMEVQIDKMVEFGIPINHAQKMIRKRMKQVELGSHVRNYDRSRSAAKLLDMPYMNIHIPADFITERYIQGHLNEIVKDRPKAKLKDVLEGLNLIEEYQNTEGKPVIRVGGPEDYAGKIAVLMAGGTNGGEDVFKAYFQAGVGTIVCMHVPENVKKAVESQGMGNIIVAGHMASDSIGLNKIIELWEKDGVDVTKMSGIV